MRHTHSTMCPCKSVSGEEENPQISQITQKICENLCHGASLVGICGGSTTFDSVGELMQRRWLSCSLQVFDAKVMKRAKYVNFLLFCLAPHLTISRWYFCAFRLFCVIRVESTPAGFCPEVPGFRRRMSTPFEKKTLTSNAKSFTITSVRD